MLRGGAAAPRRADDGDQAKILFHGSQHVAPDLEAARSQLELANRARSTKAIRIDLAHMLMHGLGGERDEKRAEELLLATVGSHRAKAMLGAL